MKILITGAHPAPAIAMMDEVIRHPNTAVVFLGRQHAQEGDPALSYEYLEVQKRPEVRFIHLWAGRLTRHLSLRSIKQLLLVPVGFVMAFRVILKEKPDAVMSFGGYIALPSAVAAALLGVPVYTHEQTIAPGLANTLIGRLSRHVFVAFPQAADDFPKGKTTIVGNPVREPVFDGVPLKDMGVKRPLLFVMGGSLGSHSLNVHIEHILEQLLKTYDVIHQTGDTREFQDYERLVAHQGPHYRVYKQIPTYDIGHIYASARLVVARAGANTVSELCALHKPSVLMPLPWSARGEQEKHARYLEQMGVSRTVQQRQMATSLLAAIEEMTALTLPPNAFQTLERLGSRTCAARMFQIIVSEHRSPRRS